MLVGLLASSACSDGGAGLTVISGEGLFDPSVLDFGVRSIGITHQLDTTLTNPQVGDLRVTDVTFDPPRDVFAARLTEGGTLRGASLASGSRLGIRILYAPRDAAAHDATMRVVFDNLAVELELKGTGRRLLEGDLTLTPAAFDFGEVELGRKVTTTVSMQNVGDVQARLREVRLGSTLRQALPGRTALFATAVGMNDALEDVSFAPAEVSTAEVHFEPTVRGVVDETLEFVLDNGQSASLAIDAVAVAAGNLDCAPRPLEFGTVRRGQTVERTITCTSTGGRVTIDRITLDTADTDRFAIVSAPAVGMGIGAGGTFDVRLRFAAEGLAEAHSAVLVLDLAHGATARIDLRGSVDPPPASEVALTATLQWDTMSTDFDLHLVRNGESAFTAINDCYFEVKNPDWGRPSYTLDDPFLDRDDINRGGPEQINLTVPGESVYDIYVQYYRATVPQPTEATVTIALGGTVAHTGRRVLNVCGLFWHVATVRFANQIGSVTPVDVVRDETPRSMCQ